MKIFKKDKLKFKKKAKGTAILETAFIFPLFILLVFLILEFHQFSQTRHAVSALAGMLAHDFSISGTARSFPKSINKFKHILDPKKVSFYVHLYDNIGNIKSHEAYFDSNGNGKFDDSEPYADVNRNNSRDNTAGHPQAYIGKSNYSQYFFGGTSKLTAGLVVVVYKFNFISWIIQKSFSSVALKNTDGDLPVIGTGFIIKKRN